MAYTEEEVQVLIKKSVQEAISAFNSQEKPLDIVISRGEKWKRGLVIIVFFLATFYAAFSWLDDKVFTPKAKSIAQEEDRKAAKSVDDVYLRETEFATFRAANDLMWKYQYEENKKRDEKQEELSRDIKEILRRLR